MSRSRSSSNGSEELEELGEDAIIAHQAAPHSPQRRANVADEARSVVISETANQPASRPYRAERAAATVVVRDRRALETARRQILAEVRGDSGVPRAIWLGVVVAVFAIVAALVVVWVRTPRGDVVQVVAPSDTAVDAKRAAVPSIPPTAAPSSEPSTPKISLDELPVERRPRRRQ